MDREGKYRTGRKHIEQEEEILDGGGKYWREMSDREVKYWTSRGSIGQRLEILNSEGKY